MGSSRHGQATLIRLSIERYSQFVRRLVIITLLLASPAVADVKGKDGRTVDCYCTDTTGLRVELGETICLSVDGRAFMAQCDMSLNVPIWRDTGQGCLSSALPQSVPHVLEPLVQPRGIDPKV